MNARRALVTGTLTACVAVALAAEVLAVRETRAPLPVSSERLLFLRSPGTADRVFRSFNAVAADVYWIRTIQHYGRDRKSLRTTDRFQLLQPLLDLTTTLDPRFNIAYRFGALFLSMEPPNGPRRPDQAIALLEKGLAYNPRRWQYAHDIGFIHYWYRNDYVEAARWFTRAAGMPEAPIWLRPLAAATLAAGGDRQGARQLLSELLTSDEVFIRQAAERALAQLRAMDAIDALQSIVDGLFRDRGVYPGTWQDLIRAGRLSGVPIDATGTPFSYDHDSHTVMLSPSSSLAPLPRGFARKQ